MLNAGYKNTIIVYTTNMSYASSLVGKEVTVGQLNSENELVEHVGIVTGTGLLDGKQVVFVDDKYYFLSEIMAVGRLPEKPEVKPDGKPDGTPEVNPDGKPDTTPEVKPDVTPDAAKPEENGGDAANTESVPQTETDESVKTLDATEALLRSMLIG